MKVYVVEEGCYSDRHIVGIAESPEEARMIKDAITDKKTAHWFRDDCITITEYDTKAFKDGRLKFIVSFYGKSETAIIEEATIGQSRWHDDCTETCYLSEYDRYVVFAKSREQAVKIARDMEAQRKAEEAGVAL